MLRTLEERDIRFVRLWFTDVLGFLKSVAVGAGRAGEAPSTRASASTARRSRASRASTRRTCSPSPTRRRSRCCRGAASRRAPRGCSATSCCPDGDAVVRRPAPRAQAHARARPADLGFTFYTHPEIEFFLFKDQPAPARSPSPVDHGGYFDHIAARHRPRLPPRRRSRMLESMGISVGVQPPRGRARPAGDRPALRRRALHRRQHHDVPARDEGGRARARASTRRSCPSRSPTTPAPACTPTCRCSRATATPSTRPAPQYQLSQGRRGRSSPGCCGTPARSPPSPTSGSTPTSGCWAAARRRRTSAGGTTTAPRWSGCRCTSPARASRPGSSCARSTRACNPYLAYAVLLAAGLKGIEEGYELPEGAEDDVWALTDARAPRAGHRAAAAATSTEAIRRWRAASSSPRRSASTSSTSSCATSGRSGADYRRQVTPFELDRYLPVAVTRSRCSRRCRPRVAGRASTSEDAGPAWFGELARRLPGWRSTSARPYVGDELPLLAGGYARRCWSSAARWAPADDAAAPWLPPTRALLAEAVQAGVPVLGDLPRRRAARARRAAARCERGAGRPGGRVSLGVDARPRPPPTTRCSVPCRRAVAGRAVALGRDRRRCPPAPCRSRRRRRTRTRRSGSARAAWGVQCHPEVTRRHRRLAGPARTAPLLAAGGARLRPGGGASRPAERGARRGLALRWRGVRRRRRAARRCDRESTAPAIA